jgi:hypothetical protein
MCINVGQFVGIKMKLMNKENKTGFFPVIRVNIVEEETGEYDNLMKKIVIFDQPVSKTNPHVKKVGTCDSGIAEHCKNCPLRNLCSTPITGDAPNAIKNRQ